jgi:tetratricopeptide (TPR) repeat protein
MFKKAFDLRDRLPDTERYLATGSYYGHGPSYDPEKSLAAYEALLATDSMQTVALNNAALLYQWRRDYDRAAAYLARAARRDPGNATFGENLVSAQIDAGRLEEAERTLAGLRRRAPESMATAKNEIAMALLRDDYDGADSVLRAFSARQSREPAASYGTENVAALLAIMRGRLAEGERAIRQVAAISRQRGLRSAALTADMRLVFLDIWYRADTAGALARLERALRETPLESLAPIERPYLDAAEVYALAGRVGRARAMLAAFDREQPMAGDPMGAVQRRASEGNVALAERRWDDAIAAYRAADVGPCSPCLLPTLGMAYDRAGQRDSAVAVYERYIGARSSERMFADALFLAAVHRRLGELYDARGDRAAAMRHYDRFVQLWAGADPELRSQVEVARRRLGQLRDTDAARPAARV